MSVTLYAVCPKHKVAVVLATIGGGWFSFGGGSNDFEGRARALNFMGGLDHSSCDLEIWNEHRVPVEWEHDPEA